VQGVLFLVAALLLFRLLPSDRRKIYPILAAVHAVILAGNATFIVVGRQLRVAIKQRWLGVLGIALGSLGLLSLAVSGKSWSSTFERGAVYPFILGEFLAGVALLVLWRPGQPKQEQVQVQEELRRT
jgi:hypothetical protein